MKHLIDRCRQHPEYEREKEYLKTSIKIIAELTEQSVKIVREGYQWMYDIDERERMGRDLIYDYLKTSNIKAAQDSVYNMEALAEQPYFGRIDFHEEASSHRLSTYYIGKQDITSKGKKYIVDWRSPVGQLFYRQELGKMQVASLSPYDVHVTLRRQFEIKRQELLYFIDGSLEKILLSDEFLEQKIRTGADDKLKDIVATIQRHQDELIRLPLSGIVVVQGVAGSGKTTVALHRISYLLYEYKEHLKPSDILIVGSNAIFMDYISEVLPELNTHGVVQKTYQDVCYNMIGKGIKRLQPNPWAIKIYEEHEPSQEYIKAEKISQAKGSLAFANFLNSYIHSKLQELESQLTEQHLFQYRPIPIFQVSIDRESAFYGKRDKKEAATFETSVDITIGNQVQWLQDPTVGGYNQRVENLIGKIRNRIENKLNSINESAVFLDVDVRRRFNQEYMQLTTTYLKWIEQNKIKNIVSEYRCALSQYMSREDVAGNLGAASGQSRDNVELNYDDLPALAYFSFLVQGAETRYKHIVVDEGQDLIPMMYLVLRHLNSRESMTVVGDVFQSLQFSSGITSWDELHQVEWFVKHLKVSQREEQSLIELYKATSIDLRSMEVSYRSAKEIAEICNSILPNSSAKLRSVYSVGEKPIIKGFESSEAVLQEIERSIRHFIVEKKLRSIAVIPKFEQGCRFLFERLRDGLGDCTRIRLIDHESSSYQSGVCIIPATLAKGLEFDAVILPNVSEHHFRQTDFDTRLLYVCMSRAMFYLHLFYLGRKSPLLNRYTDLFADVPF